MTLLLDIAALSALVLVLTIIPALSARADARITRQLREAERDGAADTRTDRSPKGERPSRTPAPPIRHLSARHNI